MSLFAALTVAVGGLNAQSRAVGNISDNLANTLTTGYKRVDTSFEAIVTQSNARVNDPGGVLATPEYTNAVRGNLVQSQTATSLAISGDGFFIVREPIVNSSGVVVAGSEDFYTRRGDFKLDQQGFLVNGAGFFLTGYNVANDGTVNSSVINTVQISDEAANPIPSSAITYRANLPAGTASGTSFPASSLQIFDNLGNQHTLSYTWTKTVNTNEWTLNIASTDATATLVGGGTAALNNNLTFLFNATTAGGAVPGNIAAAGITGGGTGTPFTLITPTTNGSPAQVSVNISFPGAGSQAVTLDFGAYNTSAGVTQFADSDLQVSTFEQNGVPVGAFRDLSIDENGFVSLNFDNGRSRVLYQVPLALFNAPNQLQRVEGGALQSTTEAGSARIVSAGNLGSGTIAGNTLESSNVDVADEFTKLIQAQRIYSANARTITTANSMLEEVINVVR